MPLSVSWLALSVMVQVLLAFLLYFLLPISPPVAEAAEAVDVVELSLGEGSADRYSVFERQFRLFQSFCGSSQLNCALHTTFCIFHKFIFHKFTSVNSIRFSKRIF